MYRFIQVQIYLPFSGCMEPSHVNYTFNGPILDGKINGTIEYTCSDDRVFWSTCITQVVNGSEVVMWDEEPFCPNMTGW